MAEPKDKDRVEEINKAWEASKVQLAQLREAVLRASELATANQEANGVRRAREKALRELGEAVWAEVQKGKVTLPPELLGPLRVVEEMEARRASKAQEIADLLDEGQRALGQMKGKTPVTSKGKKR